MDNTRLSSDKHNNGNEKDVYQTIPKTDSFAVEEPLRVQSTKRDHKARHALFIVWGGTVGTGLFIIASKTLTTGGPAFLVGSYVFISILVYFILTSVMPHPNFLVGTPTGATNHGSQPNQFYACIHS